MSAFPKYERYKDSGVEWLGDVPEHWEILPFQGLFEMSTEKNGAKIVGEMLSISGYRGVEPKRYESESQKRTTDQLADYRVVRKGQLAVNTMWLNFAGLGVSDHEGHMSPAYRAYSIRAKLNKRYAHHLLRSSLYVEAYTGLMQGIRPNSMQIKNEDFKKIPVLVPSLAEQDRIVAFLDRKTAEIDTLIAKKQRQIELLDEQKAILIHRAVTRGLNPNAKLKPSGIEWIGEIPEHWEVKKFRHCAHVRGGQVDPRNEPYRSAVLIAPDHVESGTGRILGLHTAKEQGAESGKYLVQPGDLIYSKIRPSLRKACIAPLGCLCSADMYAITTASGLLPRFLLGYMLGEGFTKAAVDAAMRVAMPKVNREALADFPVIIPPEGEQKEIVCWLAELEAGRAKTLGSITSQIGALQNFRNTLIAHAVTGRFKV